MEHTTEFDYTIEAGVKVITLDTLNQIAPEAVAAAKTQLDDGDLEMIWVMTNRPEPEGEPTDEGYYESYTETNEPELGEVIHEFWDQLAVKVGNRQVVIFCGSYDDEYGRYWDASAGQWEHYMY